MILDDPDIDRGQPSAKSRRELNELKGKCGQRFLSTFNEDGRHGEKVSLWIGKALGCVRGID